MTDHGLDIMHHEPNLRLPPGMKQCPACNIIIEKAGGDDNILCGCEAKAAGGDSVRIFVSAGGYEELAG